jgi:cytidylate kinase
MAVVTISRQYGSGGDEVASRLCELLGYRLFDKRLMAEMASQAGLSAREVIDSQEDRHEILSLFQRVFGHKVSEAWVTKDATTGARIVEVGELDSRRYVQIVRELIGCAYEEGNVVVLGRGGRDEAGADYVRSYYGVDWSDPTLYHLVLNTGLWDCEAAANIVANAVKYLPPA